MGLKEGEFHNQQSTHMSKFGSLKWVPRPTWDTAFIDRENQVVAIVDPFDGKGWIAALSDENLSTHILLTHTHRDHTPGVKAIRDAFPNVEVWGHGESVSRAYSEGYFPKRTDFTHVWNHAPNIIGTWRCGSIELSVIHSPGHAPGHVTFHGHGVYVAGDLLFTMRSGRVDLPSSDPAAQWRSLAFAKSILQTLPSDWRLIPGHRYDWIDGSTPDWVTIEQALAHNLSLNAPNIESFDALAFNRFDDDLAALT